MAMTTNGFLKSTFRLAAMLIPLTLFSTCGSENIEEVTRQTVSDECRFVFDLSMENFQGDDTRAEVHNWENGDRIFLRLFDDESNAVSARAVYNGEDSEWKLSYDGQFPAGKYSGNAVFIDGATQEWSDGLTFDSHTAIYRDENVSCEKSASVIKVTALLRPMVGRLRFHSSALTRFSVSGIIQNYKMSFPSLDFLSTETPVECSIEEDGYSRYIYGSQPDASRYINVGYDNQLYSVSMRQRILDPGVSGYLELPAIDSHDGWSMTILSIPELGMLDAYDIGVSNITLASSIVSNGNGTVSECGFCYSKSDNPTVNDAKISCGKPSGGSFTKTITGLDENTSYHVRAYAINESGVAYSEEKTVNTLAIEPAILSATTIKVEDGSTSAVFEAQIMSDGHGEISECGFCYSTTSMPDINDNKVQCNVSPSFGATVNSLTIGTRYYVRAYAINQKGVAYSDQVSFIGGGGKPKDDDLTRPNMIKRK